MTPEELIVRSRELLHVLPATGEHYLLVEIIDRYEHAIKYGRELAQLLDMIESVEVVL